MTTNDEQCILTSGQSNIKSNVIPKKPSADLSSEYPRHKMEIR